MYLATVAEHADRFDDMVNHVKIIIEEGPQLSNLERNLFSVAFKNSVGTRRRALQVVGKAANEKGPDESAAEYWQHVAGELETLIATVMDLLDSFLIPAATDAESLVFFLKMKASSFVVLVFSRAPHPS